MAPSVRSCASLPAILIAVLLTVGCTDDAGQASPATGAEPAVGQRYRFLVAAPGAEQVLTVTKISEGSVHYSVQTFVSDAPVGDHPTRVLELRFPPRAAPKDPKTETLKLAGRSYTCQVSEENGLRTYTAIEDGKLRFPGVVKITSGKDLVFELRVIEN